MRHTPATAPDLLLEESFHRPSESNRQAMPRRGHIVAGGRKSGKWTGGFKHALIITAVVLIAMALLSIIVV